MKSRASILVCVFTLESIQFGSVQAEPLVPPKKLGKSGVSSGPIKKSPASGDTSILTTKPPKGPVVEPRKGDRVLVAGVNIKSFTARRTPDGIVIHTVLDTVSNTPIENVQCVVSQLVDGTWRTLKSDNVTVPAGKPLDITTRTKLVREDVRFHVGVSTRVPPARLSQSLALPRMPSYKLHYSAEQWVLAFEEKGKVDTNSLMAPLTRERQKQLANYGFKTKPEVHPNGDMFEAKLFIRTEKTQVKPFNSSSEAQAYLQAMKALIQDSVGVWSRIRTVE